MAANMDTVGTFEMAKAFARVCTKPERNSIYSYILDVLSILLGGKIISFNRFCVVAASTSYYICNICLMIFLIV
jgi:hypothetical protein